MNGEDKTTSTGASAAASTAAAQPQPRPADTPPARTTDEATAGQPQLPVDRGHPAFMDPDRGEKICKAMAMVDDLTHDAKNDQYGYGYTSTAKVYSMMRRILSTCGLRVVSRLNTLEVSDTKMPAARSRSQYQEDAPTMVLDMSYALASTLDGPEASLEWERKIVYGPLRDTQSGQSLSTFSRRYWLTDKFLISTLDTEIDAQDPKNNQFPGDSARNADHKRRQRNDQPQSQRQEPPPAETPKPEPRQYTAEEEAKLDSHIERGMRELNMSQEDLDALVKQHNGNKDSIVREMIARWDRKKAQSETPPDDGDEPPPDGGTPPPSAGNGERKALDADGARKVAADAKTAGIDERTVALVTRKFLGAQNLDDVTLDAVDQAAAEAGLRLPTDAAAVDVVSALLRHYAMEIEKTQAQDQGRQPAKDARPGAQTPRPGNREAAAGGDTRPYASMIQSSEKTLREIDPTAAEEIGKRSFKSPQERLDALDAAIARVRGAKQAADGGAEQGTAPEPAKPQQAPAKPRQAPPQRPRNQSQPLTLDERIKFAAKQNKLTEAEFKNLQNFAKGNKETLLQLIETVGGSKKT